jgi:hypothetical protein
MAKGKNETGMSALVRCDLQSGCQQKEESDKFFYM